ncbi:MAG: NADH:ubiquinone reductase (Na(+)-transporting) subunit B [Bacteroidota bacterium]|nr:NADH:ubiquinone reductase (Na(+)-transporting) subunit B [Bacteroidota bacterium]MDX5426461.1 NADH:ubiquinone reductase (Na(+)-transporting) subunit B [Bacteroidota bacterium]MDX5448909.1 NADH:ubiquinone reductase (Na(+)-transporting) subunit B [Bacteroidota bacterium]MDX5504497.1 NADH:ubiquinone reductase (Na(+)-transporting) subunit B [Bacteroidota bacterium]
MNLIKNFFDSTRPYVSEGGKFEWLWSVHNGMETLFFVPDETTHSGAHIRDAIDMKRTMITVILALMPALLFGMWNIGFQHYRALGMDADLMTNFLFGLEKVLPLIIVSYVSGLGVEFAFAQWRRHPINEGFLVSGMLIPMIMPVDIPLWMVAISTIFAVIIGKEVFGGTGMNILNPALTARAFAFFAYPTYMSGDQVWINTSTQEGQKVVDGFSGATALGELATTGTTHFSAMDAFWGTIPGSVGETSAFAIIIGALILIASGIGSWRIIISGVIGGAVMALLFNALAPVAISDVQKEFFAIPFWHHLVFGGFAFGMVFMATDPVSAAQTMRGKWIYGFLAGFLAIMIRVFNPAYPEGVMLAILFMNVMAPLIDHYVIQSNIKKRLKRATVKAA